MRSFVLALALLLSGLASTALAQEEDESAEESRAVTFEAARGAQGEQIPGGPLLIAAYGVAWLLVLGFVGTVALRQARTAAEVKRLEQDLEKKKKD